MEQGLIQPLKLQIHNYIFIPNIETMCFLLFNRGLPS